MQYVRFGNAGIEVSRLALGCMNFPISLTEEESARLLDTALDNGVNFLDTADGYGKDYQSEKVLGQILQGKRDKIILATKFWVNTFKRVNGGGCSRVHIMQAVEGSLRRLQTDYIDLYQLHHPDKNTPVEEVLSTLDALVKQGKIRYIGVSNHYAWQMAHMLGVSALHNWEPLISIQCRYNPLDRTIEAETVPFCERFNIATMIYSPLAQGILTGKYKRGEEIPEGWRLARHEKARASLTGDVFDLLDELRPIAEKYGVGMNKIVIAWILSKPWVTTLLMGGSKPHHFEELYGIEEFTLDPADVDRIDEISVPWKYGPFWNQPIVKGPPLALNRL